MKQSRANFLSERSLSDTSANAACPVSWAGGFCFAVKGCRRLARSSTSTNSPQLANRLKNVADQLNRSHIEAATPQVGVGEYQIVPRTAR